MHIAKRDPDTSCGFPGNACTISPMKYAERDVKIPEERLTLYLYVVMGWHGMMIVGFNSFICSFIRIGKVGKAKMFGERISVD